MVLFETHFFYFLVRPDNFGNFSSQFIDSGHAVEIFFDFFDVFEWEVFLVETVAEAVDVLVDVAFLGFDLAGGDELLLEEFFEFSLSGVVLFDQGF